MCLSISQLSCKAEDAPWPFCNILQSGKHINLLVRIQIGTQADGTCSIEEAPNEESLTEACKSSFAHLNGNFAGSDAMHFHCRLGPRRLTYRVRSNALSELPRSSLQPKTDSTARTVQAQARYDFCCLLLTFWQHSYLTPSFPSPHRLAIQAKCRGLQALSTLTWNKDHLEKT